MQLHLVGGFLGSGKTTAIAAACKLLAARKLTAGVITNDLGKYLVDTAFFDLQKIPAVQVTNGCFCCNYDDLTARLDQLVRAVQPDVVFAESVGSCADVVATVIKPLQELEQAAGGNATLTVFTDVRLFSPWLAGEELPFSENVMYIFAKQIEEAGLLVLNKRDLISPERAHTALEGARNRFTGKPIRLQNSLDQFQVETWLEDLNVMQSKPSTLQSLYLDYNRYADGEAALGWLDAHLVFLIPAGGNLKQLAVDWIAGMSHELRNRKIGIGNLKLMLQAGAVEGMVSLTAGDTAGWRAQVPDLKGKHLLALVNVRVEADPSVVHEVVLQAAQTCAAKVQGQVEEKDAEAFRPGFPKPQRRMA